MTVQTQYADALALHDAAVASATDRTKDIEGSAWDAAYEAVREELGIEGLANDLIVAENALLTWARPFGLTGDKESKLAQAMQIRAA